MLLSRYGALAAGADTEEAFAKTEALELCAAINREMRRFAKE